MKYAILFIVLFLIGCSTAGTGEGPLRSSGIQSPTPARELDAGTTTTQGADAATGTPTEAECIIACPSSVGATGLTGPAGPQGPVGLQGPAGQPGRDGLSCSVSAAPEGALVSCGNQLVVLPAASEGPAGPAGDQGPSGLTGATGPRGEPGERGIQGVAGPVGPEGSAGSVDVYQQEATTPMAPGSFYHLTVDCEAGDVVLGGGCGAIGTDAEAGDVMASYPDGEAWVCRAGVSWGATTLVARVICMEVN